MSYLYPHYQSALGVDLLPRNSMCFSRFCEYNLPPKNYCEAEEDVEDSDDEIEYEGPSRRPQRLLGDFVTF